MQYHISTPKLLQGSVRLPASKSISNRALILNALADSYLPVRNLSDCDDTRVLLRALRSDNNRFDIGAAGTAMRFLTAFLAKIVGEWMITGTERMRQRPIKVLVDALNALGAKIEYVDKEGFPPLRIYGSALMGGEITLDAGISSQYISALLMIAPAMRDGLKITLSGKAISEPYIYLTLQMMREFGIESCWENNVISVTAAQSYKPVVYEVENDWSAASYWYAMLLVCGKGELFLSGLKQNSFQGDARIADLFAETGITTAYEKNGVRLTLNNQKKDFIVYDFINEPDMVQTFVVVCCLQNIPFRFSGLQSLKIKETNRIAALTNEMKKLGYILHEKAENVLEWIGERCPQAENIVIETYEDHRMAMAFTVAAFRYKININNPQVVSKSYPNFWEELKNHGFLVEEKIE